MVIGVPVYLHYCGGELEEINYILKSSSCCGGEEDDTEEANNDCCKDENIILKSNIDFTIKDQNSYAFAKTYCDLFYITLPFTISLQTENSIFTAPLAQLTPPKLPQEVLISTSVLRI